MTIMKKDIAALAAELRDGSRRGTDTCVLAADTLDALAEQNRELVTEIKIRDGMISDLQSRLAALESI